MTPPVLDLFAGPGGWSEGLRLLGLRDVGIEWDQAACATRAAAGHLTVRADAAQLDTAPMKGRIRRTVGSPPCQAWTRAGKRGGIVDQPLVHQAVRDLARGLDTRAALLAACTDPRSLLAAEPMRYLHDLRPEDIALEEVPDVLPLWQQYAEILRSWGYSTWCGILNAADYGVPQTRERAILIASRMRTVQPPAPTHSKHTHQVDLFEERRQPWVSMADALGWPHGRVINTRGERRTPGGNHFSADHPSWTLTEKTRSWWVLRNGNQPNAAVRRLDEPAPTMLFGHNAARIEWVLMPDGTERRRIAESEAAVLQAFPADFPWAGSQTKRFEQIGNAVPPLLAAHIVSAATGIPLDLTQLPLAAALTAA